MSTTTKNEMITVKAIINAPVEKVWNFWTNPAHITRWNNASDDWHTPRAENDVREGGKFLVRMEAKDGSAGFDFGGEYTRVVPFKRIEYVMGDGRKVQIDFTSNRDRTEVKESFDPEQENSKEIQQSGWQSILDNFKKYVEKSEKPEPMQFEISIDANVEKVYKTMLDDKYYREWTAEFNPASYFSGSWVKGSKMLFIGADENGKTGGMVSRIRENIPNKNVSIEYTGIVADGKEITSGPEAEAWIGGTENYIFTDVYGKTRLSVVLESQHDIGQEFTSFFMKTWPKALKKLKSICESI